VSKLLFETLFGFIQFGFSIEFSDSKFSFEKLFCFYSEMCVCVCVCLCVCVCVCIGLAKSSFQFFRKMLWKNPNELLVNPIYFRSLY